MSSIAAGIILFNPDLVRLRENVNAIYNQVELLVLVDNSSNNIDLIEREYGFHENIIIIKNENNNGIAKALNQLMSFCQTKGYSWVLTLDQDSVCPLNLIEEYVKYLNLTNVAILSPVVDDRNNKKPVEMQSIDTYEIIDKCITSASLTNVEIWEAIGGFDEEMFIDLVDFEYCRRATLNGYKTIRVNNVRLLHEVGHITQHKFLLWNVNVQNHSHFRKYYIARNRLYCAKKYKTRGSTIMAYLGNLKFLMATILYEKDKVKKGMAIVRGIEDGRKLYIPVFNKPIK